MTAAVERFPVRVMVTDVWDNVVLPVEAETSVADLKREALARALKYRVPNPEDYLVKFRGAEVLDESITIGALGAVAHSPFIVLPVRRRIVR